MRKYQQKQIHDLLETMALAQSEGSFADCQDGAIAVGEFIEQIKGEGTETVALLEEYCELVYKAYTGEIDIKPLRKQLVKIKNSVNSELKPDRIEMAFLSYKASMADSLESIYLAAKEDPNCDAYWIPIPYCSKNPDGTFKEGFFEGAECYPDYIECVDWKKYDIEARHPDVIFTFAPYDEYNYITCVHPNFFCERLKNLTDCLVYVPYFVIDSNLPETFAALPGCIHAHLVMLESETVRKQYIEHYTKVFGNSMGDPEKKFVALGSPKYDKVLTTTRENTALPEKWRELIKDKKVILYNTSISAILQGREQYLKKLRLVLETFESRDDIALWWRPHPLSNSTYESMHPHLADRYKALVAQYKKDGWGIYDDTPDLHRSIAWSDACYGDGASVSVLYEVTGKPIVFQIADFCVQKRYGNLFVSNLHYSNNNLWFTSTFFAGLFCMNLKTHATSYIGKFLSEAFLQRSSSYSGVIECDDKLFFAPHDCSNIAVYDLSDRSFATIDLSVYVKKTNKQPLFCEIIQINRKLVFVPRVYPLLLVYDLENETITDCSKILKSLNPKQNINIYNGATGSWLFCGAYAHKNKVLMPYNSDNKILIFDVETLKHEIRSVGDKKDLFASIEFDGKDFWLPTLNADGGLYRWNCETNESQFFEYPEKIVNEFNAGVWHTAVYENSMYIFSIYEGFVWEFDFVSRTFKIDEVLQQEYDVIFNPDIHYDRGNFIKPLVVDGVMYVQTTKTLKLIEYDLRKKQVKKYDINCFDDCLRTDFFAGIIEGIGSMVEQSVSLNELLEAMSGKNGKNTSSFDSLSGDSGKKIYDFVLENDCIASRGYI